MTQVRNFPEGQYCPPALDRTPFQPSYRAFGEQQGELRKKIQNYSFLMSDQIGKGYSSVVYRGLDDHTGTLPVIQDRQ